MAGPQRLRGVWSSGHGAARRPSTATLVVLAVSGSALAAGGVHTPWLLLVAVPALAAGSIACRRAAAPADAIPLPAAVALMLAGFTALQALPLPFSVLQLVAPPNADVWDRALRPFGETAPGWASISLDPGASTVEALKWLSYGALFTAAAGVGLDRRASWGARVVFTTAVVVAALTIGHALVGATKLYGLYEPKFEPERWALGPLLNNNNLAGYLNLGVFCGLGMLISRKTRIPRWLVAAGIAVLIATTILSASRGGVAALAVGLVAFVALQWNGRRGGSLPGGPAMRFVLLAVVAGGVALAFLARGTATYENMLSEGYDKIRIIEWTKPLLADYPWLGVGRGAFGTVFPAYAQPEVQRVYAHAENFVVQWISEWGLPIGLIALALLGWSLRPRKIVPTRDATSQAAYLGVGVVLLQNLVDLALEVPAVCFAVSAVLGAAWGQRRAGLPREAPDPRGRRSQRWRRVTALSMATAGVLAVAAAALFGRHGPSLDRRMIRELYESTDVGDPTTREQLRAEIRRASLRHPADPYFPRIGGLLALRAGENPGPWLARALERDPTNGRTHLLLAEHFQRQSISHQAFLHLKLAVRSEPGLMDEVARLATSWSSSFEDLRRAAPRDHRGGALLHLIAGRLVGPRYREVRRQLLDEAIKLDPRNPEPRYALARELLSDLAGNARSDECAGARRASCLKALDEHVTTLARIAPHRSHADVLQALVLLEEGRAVEATQLLEARCHLYADGLQCAKTRVVAAARAGDERLLGNALDALLRTSCPHLARCGKIAIGAGNLMSREQRWHQALRMYGTAARYEPTAATWLKVASAARKVGLRARASYALEQAARLTGRNRELRRRTAGERKQLLGQGIGAR